MNSCWYYSWLYPMIAWISYHLHHIEIIIGKRSNFDQKSKFPRHWTSKIGDFNWKGQGEDHETRKCNKFFKKIDRWPWPLTADQAVRRAGNLKHPFPRFISHIFSSIACRPFTYLLPEAILGWILDWLKAWTCFWDRFELGLGFETQGFSLWERLLFALRASGLF